MKHVCYLRQYEKTKHKKIGVKGEEPYIIDYFSSRSWKNIPKTGSERHIQLQQEIEILNIYHIFLRV